MPLRPIQDKWPCVSIRDRGYSFSLSWTERVIQGTIFPFSYFMYLGHPHLFVVFSFSLVMFVLFG